MTERTPEDLTAERLGGSPEFASAYERPTYAGRREGPGRWCWLNTPSGRVGIIWTNDQDGLGFMAVDVQVNPRGAAMTPEVMAGFSAAAEAGVEPGRVFDAYAARAGQGLWAEPVQGTLDLSSLNA